jgi:hypothetical protein
MYSSSYVFVLFYAPQSCVIVFMYVLVFHCIYFPFMYVLNTGLYEYYHIVVSYFHPAHNITSSQVMSPELTL